MILNAGSIGGIPLSFAGGIDVSDGLLDTFMLNTSLSTARSAVQRFLRLPTQQAGLHFWRCKEIVIETDVSQTVWVDGELLGPTPMTVTAMPAAINIVVP